MKQELCAPNLEVVNELIQNYDTEGRKFDIVPLYDSVNYLDEPMYEQLHYSDQAKRVYRNIFQHISSMMPAGAKLIIADCTR